MAEAKAGLKARVEAELAVAADDTAMAGLREKFASEERSIEHSIGADAPPLPLHCRGSRVRGASFQIIPYTRFRPRFRTSTTF